MSRDSLCAAARLPAQPNLIDLSRHYNASLAGTWHPVTGMTGNKANDLANLPWGLQTFAGVQFDVRGLVQIVDNWREMWQGKFPEQVNGIKVGQKCKRLHFLQGTGFNSQDGTEIGGYEKSLAT